MFLALSLREAGYSVWANTEASGTATPKLAEDANRRMEGAGVHLTGMFGIAMFLMKDWRNTPGTAEVLPFLDKVCTNAGWLEKSEELMLILASISLRTVLSLAHTARPRSLATLCRANSNCSDRRIVLLGSPRVILGSRSNEGG